MLASKQDMKGLGKEDLSREGIGVLSCTSLRKDNFRLSHEEDFGFHFSEHVILRINNYIISIL